MEILVSLVVVVSRCSQSIAAGVVGFYVPNLTELKLQDSVVPCIRDLGTGLHALKVLWMPRCKLCELDGLAALQNLQVWARGTAVDCHHSHMHTHTHTYTHAHTHANLQELYVAFNEIHDLSLVAMLCHLQVLDLERFVITWHHLLKSRDCILSASTMQQ